MSIFNGYYFDERVVDERRYVKVIICTQYTERYTYGKMHLCAYLYGYKKKKKKKIKNKEKKKKNRFTQQYPKY